MASLQPSSLRMRLERCRLGDRWSMHLRHAPLHFPINRKHSQQDARFFRSYLGPDDLFLHLLVNLYSTFDTLDSTMAYLDQDQARRLLPVLYRYARSRVDCLRRCWRYFDQEGICSGKREGLVDCPIYPSRYGQLRDLRK